MTERNNLYSQSQKHPNCSKTSIQMFLQGSLDSCSCSSLLGGNRSSPAFSSVTSIWTTLSLNDIYVSPTSETKRAPEQCTFSASKSLPSLHLLIPCHGETIRALLWWLRGKYAVQTLTCISSPLLRVSNVMVS